MLRISGGRDHLLSHDAALGEAMLWSQLGVTGAFDDELMSRVGQTSNALLPTTGLSKWPKPCNASTTIFNWTDRAMPRGSKNTYENGGVSKNEAEWRSLPHGVTEHSKAATGEHVKSGH
jgi:hypothetical protein